MRARLVLEDLKDVFKPKSSAQIIAAIKKEPINDQLDYYVEAEMLEEAINAINNGADITDEALSLFNRADINLSKVLNNKEFCNFTFKDGKLFFNDWDDFIEVCDSQDNDTLYDYFNGGYDPTVYAEIKYYLDFLYEHFPDIDWENLDGENQIRISNALSNMVEQSYVDEITKHFKKETIKQLGLKNIN